MISVLHLHLDHGTEGETEKYRRTGLPRKLRSQAGLEARPLPPGRALPNQSDSFVGRAGTLGGPLLTPKTHAAFQLLSGQLVRQGQQNDSST